MDLFKTVLTIMAVTSLAACAGFSGGPSGAAAGPLVIQSQGSFAVGGKVLSTPGTYNNNSPSSAGQTFHGDHLYAFYQVPQNARPLPIVMLHGAYQSARSWETTSDGREGFQTLFLRRGLPGLSGGPAAPWPRGQQHRGGNDRTYALRSALLRPISPGQVAELL